MATKFNLELYLLLNVNVGEMIYTQRGLRWIRIRILARIFVRSNKVVSLCFWLGG